MNSPYTASINLTQEDLSFNYEPVENAIVTHTGTNLRIMGDFGSVTYNNQIYQASELIFYRRSEHTFGENGNRLDLEMQILHRTENNNILVLVVFYSANSTNSMFMEQLDFYQVLAMESGDFRNLHTVVDLTLMLNSVNQMISYEGSLSRPPCTPNVEYLVITNIKRITQAFLDAFPRDLIGNHREVQDREERPLTLINYRGGVFTSQSPRNSVRSQSPRATFDARYDNDEVQGFRLNPDTNIEVGAMSPYPIVADINQNLPFPDYIPYVNETEVDMQEAQEAEVTSANMGLHEISGQTTGSSIGETSVDSVEGRTTDVVDTTEASADGTRESQTGDSIEEQSQTQETNAHSNSHSNQEANTEINTGASQETNLDSINQETHSDESTEAQSQDSSQDNPQQNSEENHNTSQETNLEPNLEENSDESPETNTQTNSHQNLQDSQVLNPDTTTSPDLPSTSDVEISEENRVQQTPTQERNQKYKDKIELFERLEAAKQRGDQNDQWRSDMNQESIIRQ